MVEEKNYQKLSKIDLSKFICMTFLMTIWRKFWLKDVKFLKVGLKISLELAKILKIIGLFKTFSKEKIH